MKSINDCFIKAYGFVAENFIDELMWVDERQFENTNDSYFFSEYVFVVLSSGMKNQIAQKIYDRFMKDFDLETIGHLGKRKAIREAMSKYAYWFHTLGQMNNKVEYLETLPFIGPITKYHLARNLGIDCAKPDRHLVRLAEAFGFGNVQDFCGYIAKVFGMRIGTVDLILWRYCNQFGTYAVLE